MAQQPPKQQNPRNQQHSIQNYEQYLDNINFPCQKTELVRELQQQNIDQSFMLDFQQLPNQEFQSAEDVLQFLQQGKQGYQESEQDIEPGAQGIPQSDLKQSGGEEMKSEPEMTSNVPESPEDRKMREQIEHEAGLDHPGQSEQKKDMPKEK